MKRLLWSHPNLVLLLLLPVLLLVMGFAPGARMNEHQVRQAASSDPKVKKLLSYPTVKASADYDRASDSWHLVLIEEDSQMRVAELRIIDDTGKAKNVEIFSSAEALDAVKVALVPKVRRELAKYGPPYFAYAERDKDAGGWRVDFAVKDSNPTGGMLFDSGNEKEVAQVGVKGKTMKVKYVWTGDQVASPLARPGVARYLGGTANYPYVWGLMGFVFALGFMRTDKLLHIRNLDVLALLSFLASHGFFRAADTHWAILLWYLPLLYLLARTLLMGFGYGERVEKTSDLPTPVLFVLAAFASGFVLALNFSAGSLDVAYAGVAGADRILNGILPYGHLPYDCLNCDTYGPLNYLLYVPFVLLFGWSGQWDALPSAHALTALAFAGGGLAMLYAGWRYAGARGGAALLFAGAVFPYTLYASNLVTNDIIVAAVAAIGLATAASPLARGATVSAGFAIKLYPLILAPLWMLHDFSRRRIGSILKFVLGGAVVLLLSFWVLFLGGDPIENAKLFYERTFGVQSTRESPFTIYNQVPALAVLHRPLEIATILLALLVAVVPKKRTIRRLAAFSAALIIAFELVLLHWFYVYIVWFEPFVFAALLLATNEKTALDGERSDRQAAVSYPQETNLERPIIRKES